MSHSSTPRSGGTIHCLWEVMVRCGPQARTHSGKCVPQTSRTFYFVMLECSFGHSAVTHHAQKYRVSRPFADRGKPVRRRRSSKSVRALASLCSSQNPANVSKLPHLLCFADRCNSPESDQFMLWEAVSMVNWAMEGQENTLPREIRPCLMCILNQVCHFFFQHYRIADYSRIVLVRGFEDKQIVQIDCGHQHSIALDKDGQVSVRIARS